MSWAFSETKILKARKEYSCDAWEYINEAGLEEWDYSIVDWLTILRAEKEGNVIKVGTYYSLTSGIWEGEWGSFKARLDLDKICFKYNLYVEY